MFSDTGFLCSATLAAEALAAMVRRWFLERRLDLSTGVSPCPSHKTTELDCTSYWPSRRSKSVATIFATTRSAVP
jgi:hypothetical protein